MTYQYSEVIEMAKLAANGRELVGVTPFKSFADHCEREYGQTIVRLNNGWFARFN